MLVIPEVDNPTVSIIIPTRNTAGLIADALNSIQRQTFTDFEVLINDGASEDQTVEIARTFSEKDNRFKLSSEKDEGIYQAMNKGIRQAKGQWIFFLGSDDTLYNEHVLETINKVITEGEGLKFIYGNVRHYKNLDRPDEFSIYDGRFDGEKLLEKNICHQSIFYHRSLFDQFGLFNVRYKLKADWDFNLRCFNLVNPHYCDVVITNFYAGGRSAKFLDDDFHNDMLENMTYLYPYDYKIEFFKSRRRLIVQMAGRTLRRLEIRKALKAFRILLFHLRTSTFATK